ncbi:ELM1/GtrOC1 family putative glycosyltransferase, partial [Stenotrophomonas indicatrix]
MVKRSSAPWTVTDGRAGNVRQAVALASALRQGTHRPLILQPRAPWRWLAPRRLPGDVKGYGEAFASLAAEAPALAIGCGRQAAGALRVLRARGSQVVQILDPR